MFLFFISISVVLTLGFSAIKTFTTDTNTDYRTDRGAFVSIESKDNRGLSNKQLEEFVKKLDYPIIITMAGDNDELSVFCSDDTTVSFDIEGRSFNPHELEKPVNGIMLSSKREKECFTRDGKKYISLGGSEYEVIGIYDSSVTDVTGYTSLLYKLEKDPDGIVNGFYLYGENRESCAEELKSCISSLYTDNSVSAQIYVSDELLITDNGSMFYIVLVLLIILLLLNLSTVIQLWLHSKNKEIFVRIMSGAAIGDISRRLLVNFAAILLLSFVIGCGSACAFILSGMGKPIFISVDITGTLIGFLIFLFFGTAFGSVLISKKINSELVGLKR